MRYLLLLFLIGCHAAPREIRVFAAASLAGVLADIKTEYEEDHPPFQVNIAGSQVLAQQLERGARGDIFLSADTAWVDAIGDKVTRQDGLAHNPLVVVARRDSGFSVRDLSALPQLNFRHLVIGHVDAVPVGRYGKKALRDAGVFAAVKPRLAPVADVRQVVQLTLADRRNIGVVYRSDLFAQPVLKEIVRLDINGTVQAALLQNAAPGAEQLYRFLRSDRAAALFVARGFLPAKR